MLRAEYGKREATKWTNEHKIDRFMSVTKATNVTHIRFRLNFKNKFHNRLLVNFVIFSLVLMQMISCKKSEKKLQEEISFVDENDEQIVFDSNYLSKQVNDNLNNQNQNLHWPTDNNDNDLLLHSTNQNDKEG